MTLASVDEGIGDLVDWMAAQLGVPATRFGP